MASDNDSPNPYQSPETTQKDAAYLDAPVVCDFAYLKRRQLVFLLVVTGMSGYLPGFLAEDSAWIRIIDLASGLIGAILILRWCDIDREERHLSRWRFFVPMMVLCPGPFVMMPTYLLVTRGLGGFAAIAKKIAFCVLMVVVTTVAFALALLMTGAELWPVD